MQLADLQGIMARASQFGGESDGTRTHGHRGHNPVLYQLSYTLHNR